MIQKVRGALRLTVAVCACLAAAGELHAAKEHVAERYDVRAVVKPDGSLDVVEEIAFRFSGGEYKFVNREIPARETDGVEVTGAMMDGRELAWGDDPGQIEVDYRRSRVRVRWNFAPVRDGLHVFTLRYRLAGVVRNTGGEDWFRWEPFPSRFDYPIVAGTAALSWMPDARLRRQPHTDGPVASASPSSAGFVATVANYRERDEPVVITARFEPGAFTSPEPRWQRDEQRSTQMSTAFFAAAGMIVAATILALLLFFLRYRGDRTESLATGALVAGPPDALPPALAGAIAHGRVTIGAAQVAAVAFDLAARGVIRIEEQPASRVLGSTHFVVHRGRDVAVAPHEQFVRDAFFRKGPVPRLDQAMRALHTQLGGFGKVVKGELRAAGLLDPDRAEGAKALLVSGIVVIAFALGILAVLVATNLRLGRASLLVPAAFFLSGLVMLITSGGFSTLSSRGRAAAARWDAYRRFLKQQARERRLPSSSEETAHVLPFAVALGLGSSWLKAIKGTPGAAVPPWLATLSAGNAHAAYISMLTTTGTSASHGGSGTGAAGGGSSSAG